MRKIALIMIIWLLTHASYAAFSQDKFELEIFCGYSFASLENFNSSLTNAFNYGYLDGYASPVSVEAIPGLIQADIKIRYSLAAALPVYLRLGFTRLVDTEILRNASSDIDIATSVSSFNMVYAGAGVKYGFEMSSSFSLFLGADAGCYIPADSYWEITGNTAANPPVDSTNAYQRIDFTDIYFGGNALAGAEWSMSKDWGLVIEGGYRLAKNTVTYQKTGIFTNAEIDFKELDFSGPYVTGGLVFYFGG